MVKTPTQHPTIPPLVNGDKLTPPQPLPYKERGFLALTPPQPLPCKERGLTAPPSLFSGSPFPRREGGWGVRSSHFTNSIIALHAKKQADRRNGVKEYIVWQVLDRKLSWFNLEQGEYVELSADSDGILRSQVFPGLWLAVAELLAGDMQQVLTVLQAGLQSPECAAFVKKLSGSCRA